MPYPIAHPTVIQRAQAVLDLQPIYLDTETTGTGQTDRIIQIGIVDTHGETFSIAGEPRHAHPCGIQRGQWYY